MIRKGAGEMKRIYLVYDMRAAHGTEDATVLFCANSVQEAEKDINDGNGEGVIYSYVIGRKNTLIDENFEEIISKKGMK